MNDVGEPEERALFTELLPESWTTGRLHSFHHLVALTLSLYS